MPHQAHLANSLTWVQALADDPDADSDLRASLDVDLVQNEALLALKGMIRTVTKEQEVLKKRLRTVQAAVTSQNDEQLEKIEAAQQATAEAERRALAAERRAAAAEAAVANVSIEHNAQLKELSRLADDVRQLQRDCVRGADLEEIRQHAAREDDARQKFRHSVATHEKLLESLEWRVKMAEQTIRDVQLKVQGEVSAAAASAQHAALQVEALQRELHHKYFASDATAARQIGALELRWEAEAAYRKQHDADTSRELLALREAVHSLNPALLPATSANGLTLASGSESQGSHALDAIASSPRGHARGPTCASSLCTASLLALPSIHTPRGQATRSR